MWPSTEIKRIFAATQHSELNTRRWRDFSIIFHWKDSFKGSLKSQGCEGKYGIRTLGELAFGALPVLPSTIIQGQELIIALSLFRRALQLRSQVALLQDGMHPNAVESSSSSFFCQSYQVFVRSDGAVST